MIALFYSLEHALLAVVEHLTRASFLCFVFVALFLIQDIILHGPLDESPRQTLGAIVEEDVDTTSTSFGGGGSRGQPGSAAAYDPMSASSAGGGIRRMGSYGPRPQTRRGATAAGNRGNAIGGWTRSNSPQPQMMPMKQQRGGSGSGASSGGGGSRSSPDSALRRPGSGSRSRQQDEKKVSVRV